MVAFSSSVVFIIWWISTVDKLLPLTCLELKRIRLWEVFAIQLEVNCKISSLSATVHFLARRFLVWREISYILSCISLTFDGRESNSIMSSKNRYSKFRTKDKSQFRRVLKYPTKVTYSSPSPFIGTYTCFWFAFCDLMEGKF